MCAIAFVPVQKVGTVQQDKFAVANRMAPTRCRTADVGCKTASTATECKQICESTILCCLAEFDSKRSRCYLKYAGALYPLRSHGSGIFGINCSTGCGAGPSPSPSGPPVPISVVVNTSAPATNFPAYWKRSFGSGHAALTLRPDWQQHLRWARDQLGLRGVRYHGILDDDMGVVTAPRTYNFSRVLASWDFQLSLGLVPIVELSFMPAMLANCTWTRKNSNITVNPGHAPCHGMMAYNGVTMPPIAWEDWYHLVRSLVQTATERYGVDEVRKWDFECWNGLSLCGGRKNKVVELSLMYFIDHISKPYVIHATKNFPHVHFIIHPLDPCPLH